MNILQRRMNALYMARVLAGKAVRGIVVKPRKRGASTMVSAQQYHQVRNYPHEGFIIGDRAETSAIVFDIFKLYEERDDFAEKWGNVRIRNNEERMVFSHGGKVGMGTAQGKASARGRTPQAVHETEKSHWENPEDTDDAVNNAVSEEGFSVIWVESTPYGFDNLFAADWHKARWPTQEECPDGALYWQQWAGVCPDQPAQGRTDFDYVRCFAAWYEFDTPGAQSFIRLDEDEKKHIQDTLDAESWYRGEADLIRRYGNEGPVGQRLGHEVTRCDVWEQLAWRRATIKNKCGGRLASMDSEHPADPKSCFVSSGRGVFDIDALDRVHARCAECEPRLVQIEIVEFEDGRRAQVVPCDENMATIETWEEPIVGCRYLLAVDLSEGKDQTKGKDPDAHSGLVLRAEFTDEQTGGVAKARLVGRVKSGNRMPIIPFARLCSGLSLYYGNCIHIPEMNNSGLAYITAIKTLFPWVPLFRRAEIDPVTGKKIREMDGWRTTDIAGYGGVRTQIIMNLHDYLREDRIDIACRATHAQLAAFVSKGNRMEAGIGKDDDVMALAIGLFNIGMATTYSVHYRQAYIPPDMRRLMERDAPGDDSGLAMRF